MGRPKKIKPDETNKKETDINNHTADEITDADKETVNEYMRKKSNGAFPKEESIRIMNSYREGKDLLKKSGEILSQAFSKDSFSQKELFSIIETTDNPEIAKAAKMYMHGEQMIVDAKEDMIKSLDMFIYWVISNNFKTFTNYTHDLYQEGVLGILKAMDIYDANRSKATTFFHVYIIHEMNEFINRNVNKTTAHYAANITKVKKAINVFEHENRDWTIKDIAQETGISPETILQALKIIEMSNEVHYDTPAYLEDKLSENFASPEDTVIQTENKRMIAEALNKLTEDERKIVVLKHGLDGGEPCSYKNIFLATGIPVDKIKKYYNQALRKLRNNRTMKKAFGNRLKEEKALNDGTVGIVPEDIANEMMEDLMDLQNETIGIAEQSSTDVTQS